MTNGDRLAALYGAVRSLGMPALVMGGQAVRFYGIDRSTLDYDLHVLVEDRAWPGLAAALSRTPLLQPAIVIEGPSWRPSQFRRFVVGTLPDGREERLELWRSNHLLAPFDELWTRRTEALFGDRRVAFFGIDDLIRSKETEREDDWRDVGLLEETADERRLSSIHDTRAAVEGLSRLRSRRGYERAERAGLLANTEVVEEAWREVTHPISLAYLAPGAPMPPPFGTTARALLIDELLAGPLSRVTPGSARHHALVEAVRRLYRSRAMAADRADKERAVQSGRDRGGIG